MANSFRYTRVAKRATGECITHGDPTCGRPMLPPVRSKAVKIRISQTARSKFAALARAQNRTLTGVLSEVLEEVASRLDV